MYCVLAVRFRPTIRVVHQIYRERTIGVLRTNERSLTETIERVKLVLRPVGFEDSKWWVCNEIPNKAFSSE